MNEGMCWRRPRFKLRENANRRQFHYIWSGQSRQEIVHLVQGETNKQENAVRHDMREAFKSDEPQEEIPLIINCYKKL
jgi:hypothetical protein